MGRLVSTIPYCAALLIMIVVAWVVLRLFRANLSKTELKPTDYMETFRKMHVEGKLTKEEFRIVNRLLSLQISRSPENQKTDYPLLKPDSPSTLTDSPSGNIQEN